MTETEMLGREVRWSPSNSLQRGLLQRWGETGWQVERIVPRHPGCNPKSGPFARLVRLDRLGRPLAMDAVWLPLDRVRPG